MLQEIQGCRKARGGKISAWDLRPTTFLFVRWVGFVEKPLVVFWRGRLVACKA